MAYNPFRWFTQGKYRKKPLKKSSPLLLRIQNGDFELSPFYYEARDNDKLYDKMYNEYIQNSHSKEEHYIKDEYGEEVVLFNKQGKISFEKLVEKIDAYLDDELGSMI